MPLNDNQLKEEASQATSLLQGKVVTRVLRHRESEVLLEFSDGSAYSLIVPLTVLSYQLPQGKKNELSICLCRLVSILYFVPLASNMRPDLAALLPSDKLETDKAEAIIALDFPAVEPIIPALLQWMQDINWPVAQTLQPFLARIGLPLLPHVRHVLKTNDDIWKYWVVRCVVAESPELTEALVPELQRLASAPSTTEQQEELDSLAKEILEKHANRNT